MNSLLGCQAQLLSYTLICPMENLKMVVVEQEWEEDRMGSTIGS